MVGLIPKILYDLALQSGGMETVQRIYRAAGIPEDRRYRIDMVYPDDEWQRLLGAASEVLGVSLADIETVYAEQFGKDSLQRWPIWFQMSRNAREFLERQPTIHNTFATGVRDPEARHGIRDKFRVESRDEELVTHYRSPNHLCGLYIALARWVLKHYGESASIEETRCLKKGDPECEIHIRWPAAPKP